MLRTKVILYQDEDGRAPLLTWMDRLPQKVQDKCLAKLELLAEHGFNLRRPHCDLLEKGIYELRIRRGNKHYRILYFFNGRNVIIASHGCTKKRTVPRQQIDKAIRNRQKYLDNTEAHTHKQEL
jgi:phage-related protein